jgi:hypothetical protein
MTDVSQISRQTVDQAVDEVLARLVPGDAGGKPRLARALIAERVSAVARHRARDEVAAALEQDGASWDEIADAFGLSIDDAHQHFGTRPAGLPE